MCRCRKKTERKKKVAFNFIVKCYKQEGEAPSVRRITKHLGYKSTASTHCLLKKLEEDGKIKLPGVNNQRITIL